MKELQYIIDRLNGGALDEAARWIDNPDDLFAKGYAYALMNIADQVRQYLTPENRARLEALEAAAIAESQRVMKDVESR